ncbi:isochorismatase family cysteine hydrolase [Streptomyces sp. NPDC004008]
MFVEAAACQPRLLHQVRDAGARDALRANLAGCEGHHFARGSRGGEFHPDFRPQAADVVVGEHWGSSGFANTDLDFQLKQHGITYVAVVGLLADTCVEATARFATELGYHVTLVRDATAALSPERMHAAHELTGPPTPMPPSPPQNSSPRSRTHSREPDADQATAR